MAPPKGFASAALLAQAELLHEGHQIVKEILLDDPPVLVPSRNRAEVHLERTARRRNLLPAGPLHGASHGPCEARDRTGPVALGDEHLVGPVTDPLVREGAEEIDRLLAVR